MTEDIFLQTLRKNLRRTPFVPFQIELSNGQVIDIEQPRGLVVGGDSAVRITDDGDMIEMTDFGCEEVRDIRHTGVEAAP